jgi:hypothetical protein
MSHSIASMRRDEDLWLFCSEQQNSHAAFAFSRAEAFHHPLNSIENRCFIYDRQAARLLLKAEATRWIKQRREINSAA